ncbi:DUF3306 domain-containing protein [Rhodobacteraceae bacterium LMO-12]|nr:DUF3306 domain-containing protein [Rhodobacteraceae bacterium LMO-JJ12]
MTREASFWDRRRAAVRAEEEAQAAAEQAAQEALQQQALAEKSDEEVLEELGLPDPETLVQGDDFAAFMAKAVPEHIRKRALRKLWRSNPVLACVDGLNDYDDDYLSGSYGNAPIKTSYQVGKGLLEHVLEMARQDEMAEDDLRSLDKEENLAKDDDACLLAGEESDETDESEREMAGDQEPARQEPDFSRPRRMVFHFDGNNA